jgi:hypothetical protein
MYLPVFNNGKTDFREQFKNRSPFKFFNAPEWYFHVSVFTYPPTAANMEVHHHPQLHHERKPWKEYLLEGLMIFVAVMMGFIAENIRESITNSEHARELTSQLVRDLKADTTQLNTINVVESQILRANDSLIDLLQRPWQKENSGLLLHLVATAHVMWPFHPSGGAVSAIKNELHLKRFSGSDIIGQISAYEGTIDLLHISQDIALGYQKNITEIFLRRHFTSASLRSAFSGLPMADAEIRNLSPEDLTQLGADMVLLRENTSELLTFNIRAKADAVKLLVYIKKQFDLEEE